MYQCFKSASKPTQNTSKQGLDGPQPGEYSIGLRDFAIANCCLCLLINLGVFDEVAELLHCVT